MNPKTVLELAMEGTETTAHLIKLVKRLSMRNENSASIFNVT